MELPINQVIQGNCIKILNQFPRESIDVVMFSSPYWWARDFGQESVSFYGGKDDCQHEFATNHGRREGGNFCFKCGGWMGELGLECDLQVHVNKSK